MGSILKDQNLLLDTNILIDFLRGHPKAQIFFTKINQPPLISTITTAELYSGVKNKDEEDLLENLIERFLVTPVSTSIAQKGVC